MTLERAELAVGLAGSLAECGVTDLRINGEAHPSRMTDLPVLLANLPVGSALVCPLAVITITDDGCVLERAEVPLLEAVRRNCR